MTGGEISTAELARQVRDVLVRFQGLADRLDSTYLTKESWLLYKQLVDQTLHSLQKADEAAAAKSKVEELERDKAEKTVTDELGRRIANLEDNQKWITRLILGLIIVAVVTAVLATGSAR